MTGSAPTPGALTLYPGDTLPNYPLRFARIRSLTFSGPSQPNPMTPTVFVISQPSVRGDGYLPDLTGLARYGRVQVLLHPGDDVTRDPAGCLRVLHERLRHLVPERDFIVWAGGDTLGAVLCGVVLSDLGFERVQWLRFDREASGKTPGQRSSAYTLQSVFLPEPPSQTMEDEDDEEITEFAPVRKPRVTAPEPLDERRGHKR